MIYEVLWTDEYDVIHAEMFLTGDSAESFAEQLVSMSGVRDVAVLIKEVEWIVA